MRDRFFLGHLHGEHWGIVCSKGKGEDFFFDDWMMNGNVLLDPRLCTARRGWTDLQSALGVAL